MPGIAGLSFAITISYNTGSNKIDKHSKSYCDIADTSK